MKPKLHRFHRICPSARAFVLSGSIAATVMWTGSGISNAAIFKWDSGNTTNGATIDPAAGAWNKTAGNIVWNDTGTNKVWTDANDAVFEGADGTYAITVETALSATKLNFNNSGYTLGAGTAQILTLTSSTTPTIEIAGGKSATIGNNLTVQKTTAAATWGGMTIGTAGAATGKLTIASGATLKSTLGGANNTAMHLTGNGLVLDIFGSLGRSSNSVSDSTGNGDTNLIGDNAADNVTVNVKSGGSYATGGRTVRIGSLGTAVMNIEAGGAFSVLSNAANPGQGHVYLGYNAGANATVNVNGGTFSTNPGNVAGGSGQLLIGLNATATAFLNVTAGTVNSAGRMVLSAGSANATTTVSGTGEIIVGNTGLFFAEGNALAKGTFNLDGGTLTTPAVSKVLGEGYFNFNGGTLKASKATTTLMAGLNQANVHDGGAVVDSNNFDITIPQPLIHSTLPGASAIDGGLTKIGAGTLTIGTTDYSYTGLTKANGGTLFIDQVSMSSHAGFSIGASGTLKVKGNINSAGSLSSQGNLSLVNPDINTLSIAGGITLNNSTISLDLATGIADDIAAGGAASVSGTNVINIALAPGETLVTNNYTILTSAGGLNAASFAVGSKPAGFNSFTLATPNPNSLVLHVVAGNPTPSTAYWTGKASSTGSPSDATNLWGYGSALGAPKSNWSTTANGLTDPLQVPGAATNVIFTATNATHASGTLATKLDAGYTVGSLTFNVPAATGITATSIDTNGFPLSVGEDGITLASASNSGATVQGTGQVTLATNLSTWLNQSNSKALTVTTPVAPSLSGDSVLVLGGTGTGGITLAGGLANGSGTLALSLENGGLVTLGGACSHTGDTQVATSKLLVENAPTFSSKLILSNPAADAVTFHQDTQNVVLPTSPIEGNGGIVKTGPGSLTLAHGKSSYAAGTVVNGGTLVLNSGGGGAGAGTAPGDVSTIGLMDPTNVLTVNNGATVSINGTAPFGNSNLLPEFSPSVVINQGGVLNGNAFVFFLPNLTLNGGTVNVGNGNTTGGFNTNMGLVGTVTVGGTTASTITTTGAGANAKISLGASGTGNNGVTFAVADVTGNASADLTISSILRNAGTGAIPAVSPLVKTGAGTLVLSATNEYTGDTTVTAGTLSLGSASLANASNIFIGATGTLELAHGAPDTVNSLTIGGVLMPAGTYGAGGISNSHITGTGSLVVTTGAVGTPYDAWASVIPNASDRDRTDDPDNDGFTNLSEFLFGTSPVTPNGSLVLTTRSGSNLLVRWTQRSADGIYQLQSSTTLVNPWDIATTADPAITIGDEPGAATGYQNKVATVPVTGARKFLRVFATE